MAVQCARPLQLGDGLEHWDYEPCRRTALLRKLKELFRRYQSQPVGRVVMLINPILRGWVNYFAIGHSSRCFGYVRYWGREEDTATLDAGSPSPWIRVGRGGVRSGCMSGWDCTVDTIGSGCRRPRGKRSRPDRPHNPSREAGREA